MSYETSVLTHLQAEHHIFIIELFFSVIYTTYGIIEWQRAG